MTKKSRAEMRAWKKMLDVMEDKGWLTAEERKEPAVDCEFFVALQEWAYEFAIRARKEPK